VRDVVLDASVVFKWFTDEAEEDVAAARELEAQYRLGELRVSVPYLLFLELMNIGARRRRWSPERLMQVATALEAVGFIVEEPRVDRVAHWTGRGLTAYDACYVALAEQRRSVVITADDQILSVAGSLAERIGQ
jgi:predicted nucleic acid-binding protein